MAPDGLCVCVWGGCWKICLLKRWVLVTMLYEGGGVAGTQACSVDLFLAGLG